MTKPGDVIAELIKDRCFKQGEFADKIGISRSYLNRILSGKKPLGKINQRRIADGLGIPLPSFLFLINLGAPLNTYHLLLAVADLRDDNALALVGKIIELSKLISAEKLPPDVFSSILNQIETTLKIAGFITS